MTANTVKAFLQNDNTAANQNNAAKHAKLNAILFGQDPFHELPSGVTPLDEDRDYTPVNNNAPAPY